MMKNLENNSGDQYARRKELSDGFTNAKLICEQLLDLLIEDKKTKDEIMKETVNIRPSEFSRLTPTLFRGLYPLKFYQLVIKKF